MIGGAALPAVAAAALLVRAPREPALARRRGRPRRGPGRAREGPLRATRASTRRWRRSGTSPGGRTGARSGAGAGWPQPWVRPAVVAALGVAAFTQLTGIEMMIYYAPTMLTGVGFATSSALRASLGLGLVYAVMTALGLVIVDRVGRRRLSLAHAARGGPEPVRARATCSTPPRAAGRNGWLDRGLPARSTCSSTPGASRWSAGSSGSEMYPLVGPRGGDERPGHDGLGLRPAGDGHRPVDGARPGHRGRDVCLRRHERPGLPLHLLLRPRDRRAEPRRHRAVVAGRGLRPGARTDPGRGRGSTAT